MTMSEPAARTGWAWAVSTFFGVGRIKPGPGTWGSVAATVLWFAVARLTHPSPLLLHAATAAAALAALAIGIPAASVVEREYGREDPQFVVIDEVAGQLTALVFCPPAAIYALLALLLFRIFDITKPWPARQLENLHGGSGIMMDDMAAGMYALLVFALIHHWR
ncbi:MAG: phosphatidylglycerophosphatase A [Acidobacteria bacterium]|nr:phosphatidylglycerophosphatase A [Acidobacteriota bacterium]